MCCAMFGCVCARLRARVLACCSHLWSVLVEPMGYPWILRSQNLFKNAAASMKTLRWKDDVLLYFMLKIIKVLWSLHRLSIQIQRFVWYMPEYIFHQNKSGYDYLEWSRDVKQAAWNPDNFFKSVCQLIVSATRTQFSNPANMIIFYIIWYIFWSPQFRDSQFSVHGKTRYHYTPTESIALAYKKNYCLIRLPCWNCETKYMVSLGEQDGNDIRSQQ